MYGGKIQDHPNKSLAPIVSMITQRTTTTFSRFKNDSASLDQIKTVGRFASVEDDVTVCKTRRYRAIRQQPNVMRAHPDEKRMCCDFALPAQRAPLQRTCLRSCALFSSMVLNL